MEKISVRDYNLVLNVTSVPQKPAGAGRYVYELAKAAAGSRDVTLFLCARKNDTERWLNLMPDSGHNRIFSVSPAAKPARMFYEEFLLSRSVKKITGESPELSRNLVLHGPHYTIPSLPGVAKVSTVHDLTLVEHREWHEPAKALYFGRALRQAVKRAQALICPSEYSAQKLLDIFKPKCPVVVARHGVDFNLFYPSNPESSRRDKDLLESLGISRRYVLHVGTLEPRKNIPLLIRAFDVVADSDKDLFLLLAGGDGWRMESIDRALKDARHKDRIKKLGYVSDAAVAALLRKAAAVCYPSAEEGFGLPAAEALACGAPLVTTAGSAMAEIVGGSALLISRDSRDELAEAITEQLAGGSTVTSRRQTGLELASNFTWEKSLKSHLKAYGLALGG